MLIDKSMIGKIIKYEKKFSRRKYNGRGKKEFKIKGGNIPVMISAPHAVNQYREGQLKYADRYTGAIAILLHQLTGCHIIYSTNCKGKDPNYDSNQNGENLYQTALKEYIDNNNVKVLIDIHGASDKKDYSIEMGTAPIRNEDDEIIGNPDPSLNGRDFICDLIKYTFEFVFKDVNQPEEKKQIWKNQIFDAGRQNTVTRYISRATKVACVQLEINGIYRNPDNVDEFSKLIDGLVHLINILGKIDWEAIKIKAFKLWQSISHKPQDKVEIDLLALENNLFSIDCPQSICSIWGDTEMVKLQDLDNRINGQLQSHFASKGKGEKTSDYILLTNRLIELVCGREWIEGDEKCPYLCDAPIVMYENVKDIYRIGMPKANQIDNVCFSSKLYNDKKTLFHDYLFAVYNRYTDSRFYIDVAKADYKDNGRVKDSSGQPAKKVMVPRYYKRLLGYLDEPLPMIRKEEYNCLVKKEIPKYVASFLSRVYSEDSSGNYNLQEIAQKEKLYKILKSVPDLDIQYESVLSSDNYKLLSKQVTDKISAFFSNCYEKMPGEDFFVIRDSVKDDFKRLNIVTEILRLLGVYDNIELLQIPKRVDAKPHFLNKWKRLFDKLYVRLLNFIIGKSEYLLKTEWTSETDDKNNVARLSPNIMSLLGVVENDKVLIKFGTKMEKLRVLAKDSLSDYQIGIPAPARKKLGMNSVNDIVSVHRDMKHTFWRNSQAQIIAILGTVLAVFQVANDNIMIGIIICLICIPLIMVLVLNEERIKVK